MGRQGRGDGGGAVSRPGRAAKRTRALPHKRPSRATPYRRSSHTRPKRALPIATHRPADWRTRRRTRARPLRDADVQTRYPRADTHTRPSGQHGIAPGTRRRAQQVRAPRTRDPAASEYRTALVFFQIRQFDVKVKPGPENHPPPPGVRRVFVPPKPVCRNRTRIFLTGYRCHRSCDFFFNTSSVLAKEICDAVAR